ncbi:hypothetical protein HF086_013491 [Spodoptera exigua]|uniref:Uncharacterized protein n=1 Tax=Spodoptera exigua TaxID=7107 RepID=A0A922M6X0_SPOEX|nr:hypothetical protein HF086_013491 [Spodoptera exigua]
MSCEYYVQLGTAFPHRSLAAALQLVNRSPVAYSYYWSVRPWGLCSCWEEEEQSAGSLRSGDCSERLCPGAKESRANADGEPERVQRAEAARLVRVQAAGGELLPRSSCSAHVHVPDVGARLGVQRAVLM